jgi:hypothetical protein
MKKSIQIQKSILIPKSVPRNRFLISPHGGNFFDKHYVNTIQSVRHENNKVESIRRGPNSPSKFGYLWWTLICEVKCQFGLFCNRYNIITIEIIQRQFFFMDVEGFMKYSSSPNVTLIWPQYQYSYITSSTISNDSNYIVVMK